VHHAIKYHKYKQEAEAKLKKHMAHIRTQHCKMPVGKVLVALSAPGYLKAAQSSHGCEGWQLR